MSTKEAMEAVREIEKGKGTPTDPKQEKGSPPPADPVKEKSAKAAQVPPPEGKVKKEAKQEPPKEDPLEVLKKENEALRKQFQETQTRLETIEKQKAQVPPTPEPVKETNPLEQYSEDELIYYKTQHPEYAVQIEKELHRRSRESVKQELTTEFQKEKQRTAYTSAAYEKWPELRDKNSDLSRQTAQIYNSDPQYANHPQGFYVAAQAARTQIIEQELADLKGRRES